MYFNCFAANIPTMLLYKLKIVKKQGVIENK